MDRKPKIGEIWELRDLDRGRYADTRYARWEIIDDTDPSKPQAVLLESTWNRGVEPEDQPGRIGHLGMASTSESEWFCIKERQFAPCASCDQPSLPDDYLCRKCRG